MTKLNIDTDTWNNAGKPAKTGSQGSNDLTNDITQAIQSLSDVLNTVGFMENSRHFITAMEDFGHGMTAALACVGVDLTVVGSGVTAAAAAFSSLEIELGDTLKELDTQLGYYTNTATNITLATPSIDAENALNLLGTNPNNDDLGFTLTLPHVTTPPPSPAPIIIILFFAGMLLLSPVGI